MQGAVIPAPVGAIAVRDAVAADAAALCALAAACPMEGDVGLCMEREPDFLALNRLEGERFRVGVVHGPDGRLVGCVALSHRLVHLGGRPVLTRYVSDLKVHPAYRGDGVADALVRWVEQLCVDQDPGMPTVLTVLAGNQAMERRFPGPRALPPLIPVATVRSLSVPLLWPRRRSRTLTVRPATSADIAAMLALWTKVAPGRDFSPVLDESRFTAWLAAAPGLSIEDYLLAFDGDGRLRGFLGLWDQESFKQMRITAYSPRLRAFRLGFNALCRAVGGTRLPRAGAILRQRSVVHVCVPGTEPQTLRALLLEVAARLRGRGCSFFTVGLDRRDPLLAAFSGLQAQPTDVAVCLAVRPGDSPATLDGRPVHHEIALV
jgi:ribosomal protein S18 acetylase RimI-like enzyme